MNDYNLYIFDFDGTLVDTHDAITHCVQRTFDEYGIASPAYDDVKKTIGSGIGLAETFAALSPEMKSLSDTAVTKYREIYKDESLDKLKLFSGAKEALEQLALAQKDIVIVSNKGVAAIHQSLDHFGLSDYISLVVGDQKGVIKKPDPMTFNEIIHPQFQHPHEHILMIGDTAADILFAQNAGISSCWVSYGYGNKTECQSLKPTHITHALGDIAPSINPSPFDNTPG